MSTSAKPAATRYIQDEAHYSEILLRAREVKSTLWIGTADIKDVFVMRGKRARPFLGEIADLIEKGVGVRLIHAKEPGPNFRKDFDRYPVLAAGLERVLCPRVHFKMLIFDLKTAYIGSANLTGAGIGMKSDGKRNFEAGIWTDDPQLVSAAIAQFDSVWMGAPCDACRRKAFCNDSIL
ncbi:MAG: phospholipase D-like domain-containing protein [Kiritimatiellia bacterium]